MIHILVKFVPVYTAIIHHVMKIGLIRIIGTHNTIQREPTNNTNIWVHWIARKHKASERYCFCTTTSLGSWYSTNISSINLLSVILNNKPYTVPQKPLNLTEVPQLILKIKNTLKLFFYNIKTFNSYLYFVLKLLVLI